MSDSTVKLFYSYDDHTFDDIGEVLVYIVDNEEDLSAIIGSKIEVHEEQEAKHAHFVDVESVLESFAERAYDEYSEHAEDYLSEVVYKRKNEDKEVIRQSQLKELEDSIVAWLDKYAEQPRFFISKNRLEDIEVTWQLLQENDFLPHEE